MRIMWIPTTSVNNGLGYSRLWGKMGAALVNAGVEVVDAFSLGPDLRVSLGLPKAWFLPASGDVCEDLVYLTMWDTDAIPEKWVPVLNRARAVWVPTVWGRDMFVRAGVKRPVYVCGFGVDPNEFKAGIKKRPDQPFTFMTSGRILGDRKGAVDVVKAFMRLDLPDARLVVKVSEIPWTTIVGWEDRIEMVAEHVFISHYHSLMAVSDCFVYPHKGEGFGLEPLEAMAAGTCVILTDFSGPQAYIRDGVCLPLTVGRMVPAYTPGYEGVGQQAQVDPDVLDEAMLWAYEHREECWKIGARAREYVLSEWTWARAGEKAAGILRGIMEVPI